MSDEGRFESVFRPGLFGGQVVLVTGGGSGIGRLMCLRFARLGATVVSWDINKAGNEETIAMIKKEGNKALSYTVDMTNK